MKKPLLIFFIIPLLILNYDTVSFAARNPVTSSRADNATDQFAHDSQFIKESISTSVFNLTAYTRLKNLEEPLTIYIEGDGRAWLSKNKIADDPTPLHPMVLQMASMDPSSNIAYLGRPCQYDGSALEKPCGPEYWSDKRFSEEVVASMNEAVDQLKNQSKSGKVHLIGYSGGGAVAVLIAARRDDIASLRTIAGNLDPNEVNRFHHVSPLEGSLDPMKAAMKISAIPQCHYVGLKDKVVPSFVAHNFQEKVGFKCSQVIEYKEVTHSSRWKEVWLDALSVSPTCKD